MTRRQGFTLVELLVVIAIIGTLMALLLPAVGAARERGRCIDCQNKLHQLAIAFLGHEQKNHVFPSGGWGSNWVGVPQNGTGAGQPGGWIYQILPYMDQDTIHDLGKGGSPTTGTYPDASAKRVSQALPILYCPTRRAGLPYPIGGVSSSGGADPSKPLLTSQLTQAGRTDYAANGGSVFVPHGNGPSSLDAGKTTPGPDLAGLGFNGIVSVRSAVTMANVPDEKATCYLIGEKYMSPENYITGQDQGDLFCALSGDDVSTIRWACVNCPTGNYSGTILLPAMDRVASKNPPPNGYQSFGSSHPAGWHVAYVDGHTELIAWGIDPTTHVSMATRGGHEVIDQTKIPR